MAACSSSAPWHLVFAFQALLGVVLIAATLLLLPETHPVSARVPLRAGEIVRGLVEVGRQPAFHRLGWAGTLGFAAQFLYIGGAAIFVVDLLGLGELDFWVLFAPMIGSMMVGSWISGRTAGFVMPRTLVSLGYTITVVGGLVGVALAASPLATDLPWAIIGPSLLGLGNGMAYPSIQLMTLDLVPTRRGAVMSCATFLTLSFNAVAAVALTPFVATSTLGLALTALVVSGLGSLCWAWHCAATRAATRAATARRASGGPGAPECGVLAVEVDELVVAAELDDAPVDDHGDAVGVVGGVEPVGDRDDGAALEQVVHRALERAGGARVDQRRGLVEHQRVRVGDDQPGQRDLLGLRRGEGRSGRSRSSCRGPAAGARPRAASRPRSAPRGRRRRRSPRVPARCCRAPSR